MNITRLVQKYKANRHRYNTGYNKKKCLERYTFTPYHQGNASRLFNQSLFQGHIQIFGSKCPAKEKACETKGRKLIRKIYTIGFFAV